MLASTKADVVASTEPVIGDVNIAIKATAASPASNAKQASTVKTKRRPKSKKVENKSSPTVSVLETVSVDESLQSFPKPRHSGSGNRKSSSAEVLN